MSYDYTLFACKFMIPLLFAIMATIFDFRFMRIPNWISVILLVSGLVFGIASQGLQGLWVSLAGFSVGFTVLFSLYAIGAGGAGDVKFMGGVGAWVGPYHILFIFIMSAVLLVVVALLISVLRMARILKPEQGKTEASSKSNQPVPSVWRMKIPYAFPAAVAIFLRFLWMTWINHV